MRLPPPGCLGDAGIIPLRGCGEWLQLSVFQCRLTKKCKVELQAALSELINHNADHVLLLDLGQADKIEPRVTSLGKVFAAVERQPIII